MKEKSYKSLVFRIEFNDLCHCNAKKINLDIKPQLFSHDPMYPRRSLPIAYSTFMSHNVYQPVLTFGVYFSSLRLT